MTDISDFTARDMAGENRPLSDYAGKVVLIVNTASKCGFTPQYAGLQLLQDRYGTDGFTVLGFPCNQFGGQEPGASSDIADFCTSNYAIGFPMFEKIDVNGANAHPLYAWLKKAAPGLLGSRGIKWNFTKFLLDRSGQPAARYAPTTEPAKIATAIEQLLKA